MNKNKLVRLYKDFSEGKFITPAQRKVFDSGMVKVKLLAEHSRIQIKTKTGPFTISPVLFDKTVHPRLAGDIYINLLNLAYQSQQQRDKQF